MIPRLPGLVSGTFVKDENPQPESVNPESDLVQALRAQVDALGRENADLRSATRCVFCQRIKNGEYKEHGASGIVSFEPLNPVTPGHRLFVPVWHSTDAADHPLETGRAFEIAANYARFIGGSFNLITSAGAAATQTVHHLHIHYVPRRLNDGLKLPWTDQ